MKMQRKTAVKTIFAALLSAGFCVITALASAQSSTPQASGPSSTPQAYLVKMENYIHGFVEKSGFYQTSGPNGEFYSERDHIVFDGCKATTHVLTVGADEPPYKRESVNFDVVFNLEEMDPNVVASPQDLNGNKLPDNREWVILRTADGSESITLWRGKTIASTISVYPLPGGANHEESQKLADAFSMAISICSHIHRVDQPHPLKK